MMVIAAPARVDDTATTVIVAGVDTHKDTHHVAVVNMTGQLLGDRSFSADAAGYRHILDFVSRFGLIEAIGIESSGAYGAGLTRYLIAAQVTVLEAPTSDKAGRARRGKTDQIDALAAARHILAGDGITVKDTSGAIESIRILAAVRARAVKDRSAALNQIAALRVTAPEGLRATMTGMTNSKVATQASAYRPRRDDLTDPAQATRLALKRLGVRIGNLTTEIKDTDHDLTALVAASAPTLLVLTQVGTNHAAQFLVTGAQNIDRLHSEAAFARICGAAPIPASSGKTSRMRLSRGGDRQANRALHMIAVGRLKNDQRTRDYLEKKLAQGRSKKDTIRSLKRYIAREIFHALKTDLNIT